MKREIQFNTEESRAIDWYKPDETFINDRNVGHTEYGNLVAYFELVAYNKESKTVAHFETFDYSRIHESVEDFSKHAITMCYRGLNTIGIADGYIWNLREGYQFDTDEEARDYIESLKDWGYYGDITPNFTVDEEYQIGEYIEHFNACGYED